MLAQQADLLVGGKTAYLVIDDTALPKKGTLSVGVARQYCGQLGKRANCQSLVSLTLAQGEVPTPVALRLFLPDEWVASSERCAQAGVPEGEMVARAKGEIALAELDRVAAAGARFGCVLADAGYGTSAEFRHALDERGLLWAVGIARNQKVYGQDVQLVPPAGRARKPVPGQDPPLAAVIKARWACEQAHQQLKGELGLRYFEGRSWTGLHRHALMCRIAYTYLQHLPATSAPRRADPDGAGGKCTPTFRDHHHPRACQRCAAPSSPSCSANSLRPSSVPAASTNSSRPLR